MTCNFWRILHCVGWKLCIAQICEVLQKQNNLCWGPNWHLTCVEDFNIEHCWGPLHTVSQVLSPNLLEVNLCSFNRWEHLGLTNSHGVPSPKFWVWHGYLHDNILRRRGLTLLLRVALSKKLDPIHNTSPKIYHKKQSKFDIDHTSMGSWGSKVGTLPPWWNLLTWVELGTWHLGPCVKWPWKYNIPWIR